jgi:hypothetical protein
MKVKKDKPKNDAITISGDEGKLEYICSDCNCTLTKLVDSSGENVDYFCKMCSIKFQPQEVRKSRLVTPKDRNDEVCISTTPGVDYQSVEIHKEVEVKFLEMIVFISSLHRLSGLPKYFFGKVSHFFSSSDSVKC